MSAAISIKRLWDRGSGPRKDEYKGFHRPYGSGESFKVRSSKIPSVVLPFKQRTRFPATEAQSSIPLAGVYVPLSKIHRGCLPILPAVPGKVLPDWSVIRIPLPVLSGPFQFFWEFGDRSFGIDADSQDEYWMRY